MIYESTPGSAPCTCGSHKLQIPDLDTGSEQEYERFRVKKGSFDRCIRGMRSLVKREMPVAIQTTIFRFSIDRLDELPELITPERAHSE